MSENNPEEVIVKKLDKVADSLENTTSQLSSVVTQQQLDIVRERVSKIEADFKSTTDVFETLGKKHSEMSSRVTKLEDGISSLERDHSAVRALTYSSFILSTIAIIGVVVFALQL